MKLVVILSIAECEPALHRFYRDHGVRIFSEMDIRGFPLDAEGEDVPRGWFGSADTSVYSTASFAFIEDDRAAQLMADIAGYTCPGEPDHPPHAFLLNVEQAV